MKKTQSTSWLAALAATIFAAAPVQAAGTSSAQFLKLGSGARAAAMGDAFVGVADDVTAAYWNPAGLSNLKSAEVSMMHNAWLSDTQYQTLSAALPLDRVSLAASIYRMSYGSIDKYTASNVRDGSFDAGSLAGALSGAYKVGDDLSIGGTVKYIQESIEAEKGTSIAADAGILYQQDWYSIGATVQNVGPGLKMVQTQESLPQTLRVGGAVRLLDRKLTISGGASKPNDNEIAVHAGAEYHVNNLFAIRGGYSATPGNQLDVNGLVGLTGGVGVSLGRFNLDYAVAPFGDLGVSQRISVLMRFAPRD